MNQVTLEVNNMSNVCSTKSTINILKCIIYSYYSYSLELQASPTLLQMYKLQSIYSIIKSPSTDNCQVLSSETPTILLNDVKYLYDTDGK